MSRFDRMVTAHESRRASDHARRKTGGVDHEVGGAPMVRCARWGANAGTLAEMAM